MTLPKPCKVADNCDKTWQQTKSENTRAAILEATISCFYDLGYGSTTTEKVAKRAGVSRGAMLHHFPSRLQLVREAVRYLNLKRLQLFEEQALKINEGAEHTRVSEGIDAYWEQLHAPLYTVFHELQVAARTDDDLQAAIVLANRELGVSWSKVAVSVFPDLVQSEDFGTAHLLTMCLLEGMANRGVTGGDIPEKMIPWLKAQLNEMFADVSEVGRTICNTSVNDE
jgi:AcrR family transcriptional regulator|tara:strand:- start:982 stop:1659 length:678 start_codon:yes stop_codon:yes gene_type:complete